VLPTLQLAAGGQKVPKMTADVAEKKRSSIVLVVPLLSSSIKERKKHKFHVEKGKIEMKSAHSNKTRGVANASGFQPLLSLASGQKLVSFSYPSLSFLPSLSLSLEIVLHK